MHLLRLHIRKNTLKWHLLRCVHTYGQLYRPVVYGLYPANCIVSIGNNSMLPQYLERQYLFQDEAKTNTNLVWLVWNLTLINAKPRSASSTRGDQQSYLQPDLCCSQQGLVPACVCQTKPASVLLPEKSRCCLAIYLLFSTPHSVSPHKPARYSN